LGWILSLPLHRESQAASKWFAPDFIPLQPYNDHQAGDDTTTYKLFGLVDTNIPHDSGSNGSKTVSCANYNSATGTIRLAQPRKTRSTSSVKQVTLVSPSRSLRCSPIKGSSALRMSLQIASLENPGRPVRGAIEPPAQVNPKETSSGTRTTEDISQATRPDSRGIQWWWDLDAPYIANNSVIGGPGTMPLAYQTLFCQSCEASSTDAHFTFSYLGLSTNINRLREDQDQPILPLQLVVNRFAQ